MHHVIPKRAGAIERGDGPVVNALLEAGGQWW